MALGFFWILAFFCLAIPQIPAEPELKDGNGPPALLLDILHEDKNSLEKVAERSLLKGKIDYSSSQQLKQQEHRHGKGRQQDELQPNKGEKPRRYEAESADMGGKRMVGNSVEFLASKEELDAKNSSEGIVPFAKTSTAEKITVIEAANANATDGNYKVGKLTSLAKVINATEVSRRAYDRQRLNVCAGYCKATLPPWYSDLLTVANCNRTITECVKAPTNNADCKQICQTIVNNLPFRPALSCQLFCEKAYGGLPKTLEFCKMKC